MYVRPLKARSSDESHRAATPLELFFDLVCVVAIAAVTAAYHHQISYDHGAAFLLPFFLSIAAIWWVWANFTWFATSFDNDDSLYRLLVFIMMGGFAIYAGGVAYIFENFDASLGVMGWIVMRASLVALWLRAAYQNPKHRKAAFIYVIGLTALQFCWFIGYVVLDLDPTAFMIVGAILMLGEFAVPLVAMRFDHPPFHRHHLVERHGLLNIIVLGEIILASSLYFSELHGAEINTSVLLGGGITVAITCMMWSYYFLEDDHLAATEDQKHFVKWGYLHVLVYSAGALMGAAGAAQLDMLTDHSKATPEFLALLTNGALALYIFALWLIRDSHLSNPIIRWGPIATIAIFAVAGLLAVPYWASGLILFVALFIRMSARHQQLGAAT